MSTTPRSKSVFIRWPGVTLSIALALLSLDLLLVAYVRSVWGPTDAFVDGFILNLATEVLGIAVTVGVVDGLLQWRDARMRQEIARPAAVDMISAFGDIAQAYSTLLGHELRGALPVQRYREVLVRGMLCATHASAVTAALNGSLASDLDDWVRDASDHANVDIERLIAAITYGSADVEEHTKRARQASLDLVSHAQRISAQLAHVFSPPLAASPLPSATGVSQ